MGPSRSPRPKKAGSRQAGEASAEMWHHSAGNTTTGPAERRRREVLAWAPSPHSFIQRRAEHRRWQSTGKGRAVENPGAAHVACCKGSTCVVFGSISPPCWEMNPAVRIPSPHRPSESEWPREEFGVCRSILYCGKVDITSRVLKLLVLTIAPPHHQFTGCFGERTDL